MPIEYYFLSNVIQQKVYELISEISFPDYYRNYSWRNDNWKTGFQEIVRLEKMMINRTNNNQFDRYHLMEIANWSDLKSKDNITCDDLIIIPLYVRGKPTPWIINSPEKGIQGLQLQMKYFGKVSQSKLLRFAMPSEFGAIDSRLCRVFGIGDENSQFIELLSLKVKLNEKWDLVYYQKEWPSEYGKWIHILRMIAYELNHLDIPCPHPDPMYENRLRKKYIWECADVEMALFSFASQETKY